MGISKKQRAIVAVASIAVFLALGVIIGSADISVSDIIEVLKFELFGIKTQLSGSTVGIIWNMRIPRVLLAFMVGALLSVTGAVMQSLLQNPLASAYTLGISSGAGLGVALYFYIGTIPAIFGTFTIPAVGLLFGMITVCAIASVSSRLDKRMGNHTIILTGMVFSLFVNAMLTLIMMLSKETMDRVISWQYGSFAFKDWEHVKLILPVFLIGVIVLSFSARELDNLTFGDEAALSVGIDVKKVKMFLLLFAAALTGCAVALVGIVGFVDLVIPHIVRKIYGSAHKYVVPMSAVTGGCFMIACDMIARTVVTPKELPIGAVTALVGAPFFIYLYFKGGKGNA